MTKTRSKREIAREIDLATLGAEGEPKPRSALLPRPKRKTLYRGPVLAKRRYRLQEKRIIVTIFAPHKADVDYYCPIHISGMERNVIVCGSYGIDPFQALQLAIFSLEFKLDPYRDEMQTEYSRSSLSDKGKTGLALTLICADELSMKERKRIRDLATEITLEKMRRDFRERRKRWLAASRKKK